MTDGKTTDELKDIVRTVFRDELADEFEGRIQRTVQDTVSKTLRQAEIATQLDIESVVSRRVQPLEEKIAQLEQISQSFERMSDQIRLIRTDLDALGRLTDRLSGVMSIIESWPESSERMHKHNVSQDARISTNELAIVSLNRDAQMANDGIVRLERKLLGDPNNPAEPSVLRDLRREANEKHEDVMRMLGNLSATIGDLASQVQANTTFRENRRRIEKAMLAVFGSAWGLAREVWDQHGTVIKWAAAGTGIGAGLLAALSNPEVQQVIEQILNHLVD